MTPGERCDEIIRLIDEVLGDGRGRGAERAAARRPVVPERVTPVGRRGE